MAAPEGYQGGSILPQPSNPVEMTVFRGGGNATEREPVKKHTIILLDVRVRYVDDSQELQEDIKDLIFIPGEQYIFDKVLRFNRPFIRNYVKGREDFYEFWKIYINNDYTRIFKAITNEDKKVKTFLNNILEENRKHLINKSLQFLFKKEGIEKSVSDMELDLEPFSLFKTKIVIPSDSGSAFAFAKEVDENNDEEEYNNIEDNNSNINSNRNSNINSNSNSNNTNANIEEDENTNAEENANAENNSISNNKEKEQGQEKSTEPLTQTQPEPAPQQPAKRVTRTSRAANPQTDEEKAEQKQKLQEEKKELEDDNKNLSEEKKLLESKKSKPGGLTSKEKERLEEIPQLIKTNKLKIANFKLRLEVFSGGKRRKSQKSQKSKPSSNSRFRKSRKAHSK